MKLTQLRISAVSYLNTTPLIWGLLHGPQAGRAEVSLEVPSACAASVESGAADAGIIPVIEMHRLGLQRVPGLGIASYGEVRSIFLISRVPAGQIRTLALDTSSRTSVALARIILARKYGVRPETLRHEPVLDRMLETADAALVIGDPALRMPVRREGFHVYDLGHEWTEMTGLPMVYAMWAGRGAEGAAGLLYDSYAYGWDRMSEIVAAEAAPRGISAELAQEYLTRNIVFELGTEHERGLAMYLAMATEI